jgi:hypothetical protein
VRLLDEKLTDFQLQPKDLKQRVLSWFSSSDVPLPADLSGYRLSAEDMTAAELFTRETFAVLSKRKNLCVESNADFILATLNNTVGRSFSMDARAASGKIGVVDFADYVHFYQDATTLISQLLKAESERGLV